MALRELNLIPGEVLARRDLLRHLGFWAGCLVILFTLTWGFYFSGTHLFLPRKGAVTTLTDMRTYLGTKFEEIRRIQEELDRLSQHQAVLEPVTNYEPYFQICAKLADTMNESIWLTQLVIDGGKEDAVEASLILTGFSYSNDKLGNFLDQLSSATLFESVILKHATESVLRQSNQGERRAVKLIQFQIECNIPKV